MQGSSTHIQRLPGQDDQQRQETPEDDSCHIRIIPGVLPADNHHEAIPRVHGHSSPQHSRVHPHLPDDLHQPDHLRGHVIGV